MRQILFRGKRVDNGEWVEGGYIYAHKWNWDGSEAHLICNIYGTEKTQIIPETLGQFTGLTDKNGNRIWEGDIVRVKGFEGDENWKDYDEIGKVVFVDGAFLIEAPKEYNGTKYYSKIHSYYMTIADWVTREVIGNIHDNCELLTEERSE